MAGLQDLEFSSSRRCLLQQAAAGFGWLAFRGLNMQTAVADQSPVTAEAGPLAPRQSHFAARAKRVIFLFMQGGPSHVDTFDW
ncbi:MAG: hypothetical protein ACKON9_20250, partial [Planctomycetaceae bacterium]